jgi:hypothetical protein
MAQQWYRTHPLQWLDEFLSWAITPFKRAKKLEVYATRGYYLMGIVVLVVIVSLWALGFLGMMLRQLQLQDIRGSAFGAFGRKYLPESIPFIVLLIILYWVVFFIKRLRVLIGGAFAGLFFGTIHLVIMAGEWCLERRWWSLFIVILLAGYITFGTFYFFDARGRDKRLEEKFKVWFEQVDNFSAESTMWNNASPKYQKEVSPFWDDYFPRITTLSSNHPAFTLHKMLEVLYADTLEDKSDWLAFRKKHLDELQNLLNSYRPPDPKKLPDDEKRAWAWMNIIVGRIYAHECDRTKDFSYCIRANELFGKVIELNQSTENKDENYLVAAHNGRGALYTIALRNPQAVSFCLNTVTCVKGALDEYAATAGGAECSFRAMRRENNRIELLLRVGFNYNDVSKEGGINLSEVCSSPNFKTETELGACIETKVQNVMKCINRREFLSILYVTAAKAYAVIAKLRLVDPSADVRREAKAAGSYLRLAYMFSEEKVVAGGDFNYFNTFCAFKELKCVPPESESSPQDEEFRHVYQKEDYKQLFWDSLTLETGESLRDKVRDKINSDLAESNQK